MRSGEARQLQAEGRLGGRTWRRSCGPPALPGTHFRSRTWTRKDLGKKEIAKEGALFLTPYKRL